MFELLHRTRLDIEHERLRSESALALQLALAKIRIVQHPEDQTLLHELSNMQATLQPYIDLHAMRVTVWQAAYVASFVSARKVEGDAARRADALLELLPPRNPRWWGMSVQELEVAYGSE